MKTTIYWTMQHSRRAVEKFRFRATCWWLSQQVEFLEWRQRLEVLMPPAQSDPVPTSVGQGGQYTVHSM
ncbi:MAG: hypothetical protein L0Z46_02590 [Nitrospiraceae bacterium]|nr:hypothetical protein [Nitrospiraceae bacterium]